MPQLAFEDWAPQLVWLAITFITLYFIMARVAIPRIGTVIEERKDRIASDLDQAEQFKRDTEQAIAAYEQALAEARARAHTIAQQAREKLNAEVEAERAAVEKQLAEKTAEAEARIAASKEAALSRVADVASETAQAIVTQLIGGKVTKAEVKSAIEKAQAG
ncbi:MAG: F0F1 ATP synthase subunit B [Alphaproteobacteria bacterium]|nr:MAG: F0F1 ATP synthase subunit B [Alphaproteobacteria bacterium]